MCVYFDLIWHDYAKSDKKRKRPIIMLYNLTLLEFTFYTMG